MKSKIAENGLQKEKLEIIKWVKGLKDETAMEKLRLLRKQPERSDWWSEVTDEEKAAIDKGLEDIKAGRVIPHQEAKKLYEKWL